MVYIQVTYLQSIFTNDHDRFKNLKNIRYQLLLRSNVRILWHRHRILQRFRFVWSVTLKSLSPCLLWWPDGVIRYDTHWKFAAVCKKGRNYIWSWYSFWADLDLNPWSTPTNASPYRKKYTSPHLVFHDSWLKIRVWKYGCSYAIWIFV